MLYRTFVYWYQTFTHIFAKLGLDHLMKHDTDIRFCPLNATRLRVIRHHRAKTQPKTQTFPLLNVLC